MTHRASDDAECDEKRVSVAKGQKKPKKTLVGAYKSLFSLYINARTVATSEFLAFSRGKTLLKVNEAMERSGT